LEFEEAAGAGRIASAAIHIATHTLARLNFMGLSLRGLYHPSRPM
jgi:hypothetical protein